MISLLADYNSMVIFKTVTFMFDYIDWICIVLPLLYIVYRFYSPLNLLDIGL